MFVLVVFVFNIVIVVVFVILVVTLVVFIFVVVTLVIFIVVASYSTDPGSTTQASLSGLFSMRAGASTGLLR